MSPRLLFSLAPLAFLALPSGRQDLRPFAQIAHPPIDETSGMVKSRRFSDVYWVHNDSGDVARVFGLRGDATLIVPEYLRKDYRADHEKSDLAPYGGVTIEGASNIDWEDITILGDDLVLADMGNNGNGRRDLGVYLVREPNPLAVDRARAYRWIPIAYPDQTEFPGTKRWEFDCEAVFAFRGKLWFLTKHRANGNILLPATGTNLYRLDGLRSDRVNVLTKTDGKTDLGGWVTGADVSPDGRTLAVLCHLPVASVWLFDLPRSGDRLLSGRARRLPIKGVRQAEAIAWESNDWIRVANEQRDVYRLAVRDFAPADAR